MKAKEITTKCLPVVENLDEFSTKLLDINQNEEDYCAYITSLADIFYWLNIESVWGKMGFQWNKLDDYGRFTTVSIPFTIIPRIPDGHRIKQFDGLLTNLSGEITVHKSNWENLTKIKELASNNITYVNLDLTGAPITSLSESANRPKNNLNVYLKANLENLTYIYIRYNENVIFDIDKNNANLKINLYYTQTTQLNALFNYLEDDIFDTSNLFSNVDKINGYLLFSNYYPKNSYFKSYTKQYIRFKAKSSKYYIINFHNEDDPNAWLIDDERLYKSIYTEWKKYSYLKNELNNLKENKIDVDLDISKCKKVGFITYPYSGKANGTENSFYNLNVNFIGDENSIESLFYYLSNKVVLKEDGDISNKINNNLLSKIDYINGGGVFYHCLFNYMPDITFNLYDGYFPAYSGSTFVLDEDEYIHFDEIKRDCMNGSAYSDIKGYIFLKFINSDYIEKLYLPIGFHATVNKGNCLSSFEDNKNFNIRDIYVNDCNNELSKTLRILLPKTSTLKVTYISYDVNLVTENLYSPNIELIKVEGKPIRFDCAILIDQDKNYTHEDIFDYLKCDISDRNYLKSSTICTVPTIGKTVTIKSPFIASNVTLNINDQQFTNIKFIYKATCNFSHVVRGQTFIDQLLEAIEPNDSDSKYTITIRNEDYLLLTQEQIEYITITCNYTLVNKIV